MFSVKNRKKFIPSTKRLFKTSAKERRSNPMRLTALIYLSPFRCATDVERSSCKFLRNFTCCSASEILRCFKALSSNDMPHKRLDCRKCKKKNFSSLSSYDTSCLPCGNNLRNFFSFKESIKILVNARTCSSNSFCSLCVKSFNDDT